MGVVIVVRIVVRCIAVVVVRRSTRRQSVIVSNRVVEMALLFVVGRFDE